MLKALDLFCCAGGAAMGLHRAGFTVTGVDINDQPEYPFEFIRADATKIDLRGYDLIWASPPCQAFSAYRRRRGHVRDALNLIPETRARLKISGTPYIIENVVGAPLESPIMLCGSMFGLDVQRHRLFETSFEVAAPTCDHSIWMPRFPPATNRQNKRKTVEVGVWRIPLAVQQRAIGIDWMSLHNLSQAIPPAYSEWLARQFLAGRETA